MKIIGITGGIGTGKSTILHILEEEYHAYIIETDRLAHHLMGKGQSAYNEIINTFGFEILDSKGQIDRAKLGSIVFADSNLLNCLNKIVHPAVKHYIKRDIEDKKNAGNVEYYVIEAALLLEDGYKEICDVIWGVHVDLEHRIERLLAGRGGTRQKWLDVIKNQSSEEFYQTNCDAIINNDIDLENTKSQLKHLITEN